MIERFGDEGGLMRVYMMRSRHRAHAIALTGSIKAPSGEGPADAPAHISRTGPRGVRK